jgi:hypothetical protein
MTRIGIKREVYSGKTLKLNLNKYAKTIEKKHINKSIPKITYDGTSRLANFILN